MTAYSAPSDQLQQLSLHSQMSSNGDEVRARAIEVRDVLSSFDRDLLPTEFCRDTFAHLDRPLAARAPQSEWTVPADIFRTLLQWGSYDELAHSLIMRLQDAEVRARLFHEKLARRLGELFTEYDDLDNECDTIHELEQKLLGHNGIIKRFYDIVTATSEDSASRKLGKKEISKRLLNALFGICDRNDDVALRESVNRKGRQASSKTMSLFKAALEHSSSAADIVSAIITILESYPPAIMIEYHDGFRILLDQLREQSAPEHHTRRISTLVARLEEAKTKLDAEAAVAVTKATSASVSVVSALAGDVGVGDATAEASSVQLAPILPRPDPTQISRPTTPAQSGTVTRSGTKRSAEVAPGNQGRPKKRM